MPYVTLITSNTHQWKAVLLLGLCMLVSQCKSSNSAEPPKPSPPPDNAPAPKYGYQVVNIWAHDPYAFTQGLVFLEGKLLESTGEEGHSSLRRVDLETGRVLKKVDIPPPYFAEGIAVLNGKIYQLTWQHGLGFIYDAQTFERLEEFKYEGEGWGLTTDGKSLILSDGTDQIRFIDPASYKVTNVITVVDNKTPIDQLNELEWVNGEIYANVWHDEKIAVIDPQSGRVRSWIDLTGLMPREELDNEEAVLNGIAYDQASGRLFATGKLWPRMFEIKVKK
jgi:glutaminyl-peptide cyclotransferase